MTDQHSKFVVRLAESRRAVFRVGEWLNYRGHDLFIPATTFAPTAADAPKHIDRGDIRIISKSEGVPDHVIEVKHTQVEFTCENDYPHSFPIVSNMASVERNRGNIFAYIVLSKDMKFGIIMRAKFSEHWFPRKIRAGNTGNVEDFYMCPMPYADFLSIEVDQSGGAEYGLHPI